MEIILKLSDSLMMSRREGDYMPPWYYGYAYRDVMCNYSVFAVMPLNWMIRAGRYISWKWDDFRGTPPKCEFVNMRQVDDFYQVAYEHGKRDALSELEYESKQFLIKMSMQADND